MVKKRVRKVFAYRIETPLFDLKKNQMKMDCYDNTRFEKFLKQIITLSDRKLLIDDSKLIRMEILVDSDDYDFLEGIFIASRFGEEQDIIDVDTLNTTGKLRQRESVKGEVSFVLCKKTGLLLVQSDSSLVVNRNTLDKYFSSFSSIINSNIIDFNKANKDFQIPNETAYFTIRIVPSDDFFKKIRQLARIKGASVFVDTIKSPNNKAIEYFRKEAEGNNVDDFGGIRISLINSVMGSGVRNVENYFRKLVELQKYDKFEVEGKTPGGRDKKVTMKIQDTSFEVKVPINNNGVIDRSVLLDEMIKIAKFQNPLME